MDEFHDEEVIKELNEREVAAWIEVIVVVVFNFQGLCLPAFVLFFTSTTLDGVQFNYLIEILILFFSAY